MAEFDPYLKWLGIREDTRPLDHYTLLGIERFEDDQDVIVSSADRQMAHIRSFQTGARGEIAQKVLNQLARARRCLMTEDKKKAYDLELRAQLKLADPSTKEAANSIAPIVLAEGTPPTGKAPADAAPQVPQIVTGSEFDVGEGSSSVGSIRSRKKNNGVLWTVVGGLGGGICAIIFCFFLLNGSGLFKTGELDDTEDPSSAQKSDKGSDSSDDSEVRTPDPPWQSPLEDGGTETKGPDDTNDPTGLLNDPNDSSGPAQPIGPTGIDSGTDPKKTEEPEQTEGPEGPEETEGPDSDGKTELAKQFQNQLDVLFERYQARVGDSTGEAELKSLRSESAEIVAQNPQFNLVDRIEEKFPADSDTVVAEGNPDSTIDVELPDLSLPKFYSELDLGVVKKEVPDDAMIREQQALIESIYEAEFKAAKDDMVAAHAFAKQLVAQASNSTDSPAQIYVMFQKAIELGRKIGDGESAAKGFLGLRDQFNVPENWENVHRTIDTISRKVKTEEQARVFYRGVDQLSQRAYAEGNLREAEFLVGKGLSIARKQDHAMGIEHYARLRDYFGDLEELQSLNQQTDQEPDPSSDDSPTLVEKGNFLVYLKQDEEGFDYWAKSDNEALSDLAKMEIGFAEDPNAEAQFQLGKAWYEKSKKYKSFEDHFGLARAASLLRPVLDQLNGIERTVAANYVERIDNAYAPIFANDTTVGAFPSVLKEDTVFYFAGEDKEAQSKVPSGVYLQFYDSGSVRAYFEVGGEANQNDQLSYDSMLGGISIVRREQYRISIHATKRPMKLGLEILDSKGRASQPLFFDQSPVPSALPERFRE